MAALAIEILGADEPASQCLHAKMLPFYFKVSKTDKSR